MKLIKYSFISVTIILAIAYIPLLLNLNKFAIFSIISLQVIPGFIYSWTQSYFCKNNPEFSATKRNSFIFLNAVIYFLIIFYMGTEIHDLKNFRIITAGGLGALLYLLTHHICFKITFPPKTYILAAFYGVLTTFIYWQLDNNYQTYFVYYFPIIIVIWQIGISIIIYATNRNKNVYW